MEFLAPGLGRLGSGPFGVCPAVDLEASTWKRWADADAENTHWRVSIVMGVPPMGGLYWKMPLRWMI